MHEKRQALRFLHICLASVLNLRSPDDSQLPGSPMDKLAAMLFGDQVRPRGLPCLPCRRPCVQEALRRYLPNGIAHAVLAFGAIYCWG